QVVDHEALGGAKMHAAVSGTIDYREPTDEACLERLRRLIGALPPDRASGPREGAVPAGTGTAPSRGPLAGAVTPLTAPAYDVRDLLKLVLDDVPFDEYKAEFGPTLVCGYGKLGGIPVGVVANQKKRVKPADGPVQFGGVIYVDSADKAAR